MDQKLFFLINREWTSPVLDLLMATLSSLDFWIPLLFVLILWVFIRGSFKARAAVITLVVTVGLADGVIDNGLKHAVNRPRPRQVEAVRVVDLQPVKPRLRAVFLPLAISTSVPESAIAGGRSFPSSHTANNFAIGAILAGFYHRRGWLYFFFAAGVAYSRIYVGAHWPSDVFASMFIGVGLGLFGLAGSEWLWRNAGGWFAPTLHRRHFSLLKAREEAVVSGGVK